jgi:Mg-chelatase subunit ChlD
VVFETKALLDEWHSWLMNHSTGGQNDLHDSYSGVNVLLTSMGLDEQKQKVQKATRQFSVTLTTREFGRGTDFVCHDSKVKAPGVGGVFILQTFFAESLAEETQIKGRTCRQDDPGKHRQILFHEDLDHFIEKDSNDEKLHSSILVAYSQWRNSNKEHYWEHFLVECRKKEDTRRFKRIEEGMEEGKTAHERTVSLANKISTEKVLGADLSAALLEYQAKKIGGTSKPKDLVFVLDYSGSMGGDRITAAVESMLSIYDNYVYKSDRCAFIRFASKSEMIFDLQSKNDNIRSMLANSKRPGGMTAFRTAVQSAMQLLNSQEQSSGELPARGHWIIALTDGSDNQSSVTNGQLCNELKQSNCCLITVGITMGSADQKLITSLCGSTDIELEERMGKFINTQEAHREALEKAFAIVESILKTPEMMLQTGGIS